MKAYELHLTSKGKTIGVTCLMQEEQYYHMKKLGYRIYPLAKIIEMSEEENDIFESIAKPSIREMH